MASLPKVTIVTPSFNQASYLEQTMRSVLEQGYPNLEYIVVDGGSTDDSIDIIRRYEKQLTWWVSEPDHGQAEAINKGLDRATGEIVAWLNSDDTYLPGAIIGAVRSFESDPTLGLVYGDVLAVDATDHKLNTLRYQNWGLEGLLCFRIIGQPAVFMRRRIQESAGRLDETYHYLLDHQLWLRIANIAQTRYVPQLWASARFHPAAKNIAQAAGFGEDAYRIIAWMQSNPDFIPHFQRMNKHIWAGAHRLNAWYLCEGGQYRRSLSAYGKAFSCKPAIALADWPRILYAMAGMLGMGRYRPVVDEIRRGTRR
jgi:glycosyltransferase involved in cell wall biosynthesis